MIHYIKNGEKKLKKEIIINANGPTALIKINFMLIILISGPIFPV